MKKAKLTIVNFKISEADRKLFKEKALKYTGGNVSALILRAVKLVPVSKLKMIG